MYTTWYEAKVQVNAFHKSDDAWKYLGLAAPAVCAAAEAAEAAARAPIMVCSGNCGRVREEQRRSYKSGGDVRRSSAKLLFDKTTDVVSGSDTCLGNKCE